MLVTDCELIGLKSQNLNGGGKLDMTKMGIETVLIVMSNGLLIQMEML